MQAAHFQCSYINWGTATWSGLEKVDRRGSSSTLLESLSNGTIVALRFPPRPQKRLEDTAGIENGPPS